MTKNQFTKTATQPRRNRKFRQYNNDQYCKLDALSYKFNCFGLVFIDVRMPNIMLSNLWRCAYMCIQIGVHKCNILSKIIFMLTKIK